jgi:hypothetical protein
MRGQEKGKEEMCKETTLSQISQPSSRQVEVQISGQSSKRKGQL